VLCQRRIELNSQTNSKKRAGNDNVLAAVALILAFASVVLVISFLMMGENVVPVISNGGEALEAGRKKGYKTYLIAGTDTTSNNTDVLMLASLDTSSGEVKILQIPRDTYVSRDVTGYSTVKRVNGIYAAEYAKASSAGLSQSNCKKRAMEALCSVLEKAFCTRIDEYVVMNTYACRNIVDLVGGVWFDVPYDMFYEDPYQNLYIDLKQGYQLLDGEAAEQLIRFREPVKADIGRISMRAEFIKAMAKQVKSNLDVSAIAGIVTTVLPRLTTSMSLGDAIECAKAAFSVSLDNIEIKTLTGSSVWDVSTASWSASYYLNKAAALDDINKFANVYTKDITIEKFDASELFCDKYNESAEAYYKREDLQ